MRGTESSNEPDKVLITLINTHTPSSITLITPITQGRVPLCVTEPHVMDPVCSMWHVKGLSWTQSLMWRVREPIIDPLLDVCVREPIMDPVLDVYVREPIAGPSLVRLVAQVALAS